MRLLINAIPNIVKFASARYSTTVLPKTHNYALKEEKETTGLHRINTKHRNPFELFKEWYEDYQTPNHISSKALSLSTANKKGEISSRTLLLRRLDEDGMVIMTDNRSRKSRDLKENPYASMLFLWISMQDNTILSRQARVEGSVRQLPNDEVMEIFETEPLFCKIRAHICHQGTKSDWEQMKSNHDNLLQKFEAEQHNLEKPNHVVAYKLYPSTIEFYESMGQTIGDRLLYVNKDKNWEIVRLAA